jgi:peptide/nickel transport system substrate-binding protein
MMLNGKNIHIKIGAVLVLVVIIVLTPYQDVDAPTTSVTRENTVIFDLDRTIKTPENFNWLTPGVKRLHGAHQAMWEPLFILSYSTGELQPWLGLSIESNSTHDIWILTLREDVKWSDGEVFNADDVLFTATTVLESSAVSAREALNFKGQVQTVIKLDDYRVEFRLKRPNPSFHIDNFAVQNFSSFLVMPEHIWAGKDMNSYDFYPPIGTGPYTFHSATTQRAIWDLNEDWWGAKAGFRELPEPLRLIWLESGGQENRAQMLQRNQLDAGQHLALGIFEAIKARNPNIIAWYDDFPYSWTDPCPRQLEFNTTIHPWDEPTMRKAISYIIDRQQIIDIVYEGSTLASRTMFVEYGAMTPFINEVIQAGYELPPKANITKGQRLIESNGYRLNDNNIYSKGGELLTANIMSNTASSETTNTVDLLVEQLQQAGIDARAIPIEDGVFWGETIPLGKFEMSYSWLSCGSVTEPWASMNRYTNNRIAPVGQRAPGFNNTGRWNSEAATRYTEIVNEMGKLSLGDPRVNDLVPQAYFYLDTEMPFIPLVQAAKVLSFNQHYWKGWPSANNYYTHPMHWWNSTHLIIHNLKKVEPSRGEQDER